MTDVGTTHLQQGCFACGYQKDDKRPRLVVRGDHIVCERCGGGYAEATPGNIAALSGDPEGLRRSRPSVFAEYSGRSDL